MNFIFDVLWTILWKSHHQLLPGTTEIDPSSIFSLGTFTDTQANSGSSQSSFTLGDTVYGFVGASSMSTMPAGINWEVNECIVSILDGFRYRDSHSNLDSF